MMSSRRGLCGLLLSVSLASCGCTSGPPPHVVSRDSISGVVAVSSKSDSDRRAAEALMLKHLPQGYVIDSEVEVVVGSPDHPKREWQLHYRDRNAPSTLAVKTAPAPAPAPIQQAVLRGPEAAPPPVAPVHTLPPEPVRISP
jgi:hypothetical protein